MFNYADGGYLGRGIVYHCVVLIVVHVNNLIFKTYRTVFKITQPVLEKFIYCASVDSFCCDTRTLFDESKIIGIQLYLRIFQQLFNYLRVAAHRYSLITVAEIIVVVSES